MDEEQAAISVEEIIAFVSSARESLNESSTSRSIKHPVYLTAVDSTVNDLNRTPYWHEKVFIQEMINLDLEELQSAYRQLQRRKAVTQQWQDTVNRLESGFIILRTTEESIQLRLETNQTIQQKLNSVMDYTGDRIDGEARPDIDYPNQAMIYSKSIDQLTSEVDNLVKDARECSLRIRQAEETLSGAKSSLLESRQAQALICDHILQLKLQLDQKKARLSAARRLPVETLVAIFNEVIRQGYESVLEARASKPNRLVLILARICRQWRRLVHASPSLWRYIPIAPLSEFDSPENTVKLLNLYFKNALQRQSLVLHWPTEVCLYPVNHRLRFLHPEGFFNLQEPHIKKALSATYVYTLIGGYLRPPVCRIKYKQPPVECVFYDTYPRFVGNARNSLQSLRLDMKHCNFAPAYLSGLFREFVNIAHFDLQGVVLNAPAAAQLPQLPQVVELPRLTQLTMTLENLNTLLQYYFSAPALTHLFLIKVNQEVKAPALQGVISSGIINRLLYLGLSRSPSAANLYNHWEPFLKLCTSVKTLELRGLWFLIPIKKLAQKKDILPSMRGLVLRCTNIRDDVIQEFLDSRKDSGGRGMIRHVTFDHCSSITRSFCEKLIGELASLNVYS